MAYLSKQAQNRLFDFNTTTRPHAHSEIWEKFVEFESSVGDLASVISVEKRRTAALKNDVRGVECGSEGCGVRVWSEE